MKEDINDDFTMLESIAMHDDKGFANKYNGWNNLFTSCQHSKFGRTMHKTWTRIQITD